MLKLQKICANLSSSSSGSSSLHPSSAIKSRLGFADVTVDARADTPGEPDEARYRLPAAKFFHDSNTCAGVRSYTQKSQTHPGSLEQRTPKVSQYHFPNADTQTRIFERDFTLTLRPYTRALRKPCKGSKSAMAIRIHSVSSC